MELQASPEFKHVMKTVGKRRLLIEIQESVELAHEVFNRVYRRVPEQITKIR